MTEALEIASIYSSTSTAALRPESRKVSEPLPSYSEAISTPRYRRVLKADLATIFLAIWSFAWSISGVVDGNLGTKISTGVTTLLSLCTIAIRVPVIYAVIFEAPDVANQKFAKYHLGRRGYICQHIWAIVLFNASSWPAVVCAYTNKVTWINIAVTVVFAFQAIAFLISYILARACQRSSRA